MVKKMLLMGMMLVGVGSRSVAQDKKAKNPEEGKKGTVTGVLTAKAKNFIEVRGDGEESSRKYFLLRGGTKKLLDAIDSTPVGGRVRIDWIHLEHFRVVDLEPLRPTKN